MSRKSDILATAARLLSVKKARGLSAKPPPASQPWEAPVDSGIACVNCGYNQQGQRLDRCPECGLILASRLRDSTPWTTPISRPVGWWETARRVWLWDHRVRLRTSYLPVTPESQAFAKWSIALSAVLLGLALATINWNAKATPMLASAFFVLQTVIGAALAGLLLWGGVYGLTIAIQGTWRRRLRFIPSSIHYATAWGPPLSLLALVSSGLYLFNPDDTEALLASLPLLALATWGLWLWGSITESEHVTYVAARIALVALCLYVASTFLILIVPGSSRMLMVSLLDRTSASLVKLNVFGTYSANPVKTGPQTYALLIDMIPSGDEDLVSDQIARLGAADRVYIRNEQCTLEQIDKAFATARGELRAEDKFILYINGHGAANGSGSIRMVDGELTSQKLAELLKRMPTDHCLVVIDSCFGGKFIPALDEGSCNAVVITASDDRNVAFRSGLRDFWKTLDKPESDLNGDGLVTVHEAFWSAFRSMLQKGEQTRQAALAQAVSRPVEEKLLEEKGFATPQLDVVGKAGNCDFGVAVSQKKPGR